MYTKLSSPSQICTQFSNGLPLKWSNQRTVRADAGKLYKGKKELFSSYKRALLSRAHCGGSYIESLATAHASHALLGFYLVLPKLFVMASPLSIYSVSSVRILDDDVQVLDIRSSFIIINHHISSRHSLGKPGTYPTVTLQHTPGYFYLMRPYNSRPFECVACGYMSGCKLPWGSTFQTCRSGHVMLGVGISTFG